MTKTECPDCLSDDLAVVFGHDCPDDPRFNGDRQGALAAGTPVPTERPLPTGTGTGSGRRSSTSQPASEKQVAFLVKLGMDEVRAGSLTKSAASDHISRLLDEQKRSQPEAPKTEPTRRPNRYAGKCVRCGGWVEAEAGYLAKDAAGKWAAEHVDACPEAAPAPVELEDGIYKLGDEVRKVYHTVHGRNEQVAKVWTGTEFEYVGKRGLRGLAPEHKMTFAEAVEFGRIYGICCNCGRTLTDEHSIEAGIGPICAQKFA